MNERIREIADEAEAQYCDLGDASCFKRLGLVEAVVFKPEDLEKFAELIVRECCDVLQTETIRHDGYGYNQGFLHKKIKQHFGVEE